MKGVIMSTEKTAAEDAKLKAGTRGKQQDAAETVPDQQLRVLSLEIEDDNSGGDPYNRTGQFCLIELRNKEQ